MQDEIDKSKRSKTRPKPKEWKTRPDKKKEDEIP